MRQVTVVMGTQMSKTETALNLIGWTLHDRPVPIIYVGPTQRSVGKISKADNRFDALVKSVPELLERVDPRAHLNNAYDKMIAGVRVLFAWAGSESEVASDPAGLVIVDEYDKMEAAILVNAFSRVKTFSPHLVFVISTPTWEGDSNIAEQFDAGTRERWHWRCPGCREWFYPRRDLLTWDHDAIGFELEASAGVACPSCGQIIREEDRDGLEARWFATRKPEQADDDDDEQLVEDTVADERLDIAPAMAHRSFAVSGLCSWSQTIGITAQLLDQAQRSGNQLTIKEVVNEHLGEVYRVHGDTPGWRAVWRLREAYERPPEGRFITIGADVAADRVDFVVRLWGALEESWLLAEGELYGSTLLDEVFLRLQREIVERDWGWPVRMALVDQGYRPASVWRLADRCKVVWPCSGIGRTRDESPAPADAKDKRYWRSRPDVRPDGLPNLRGQRRWSIDVAWFKSWLYGRIRAPRGEAGEWHVRDTVTRSYCRQVTNEELVDTGKRLEWHRTGDRQNHKLDCEVYATAAAFIRGAERIKPRNPTPPSSSSPPPTPQAPAARPRKRSRRFGRRPL